MGKIETARTIEAPPERVFDVVAHVENFRKAVPDIIRIEYVGEQQRGAGTRFRETRRMGKREATVELEVREYEPHRMVRMVSDAGGTVWDTVFRVEPKGAGAELTMVMEERPHKLLARLFVPLIRPMVRKAVGRDLDAVKAFCERGDVSDADA